MALGHLQQDQEGQFDEKNQTSKISCYCPFKLTSSHIHTWQYTHRWSYYRHKSTINCTLYYHIHIYNIYLYETNRSKNMYIFPLHHPDAQNVQFWRSFFFFMKPNGHNFLRPRDRKRATFWLGFLGIGPSRFQSLRVVLSDLRVLAEFSVSRELPGFTVGLKNRVDLIKICLV